MIISPERHDPFADGKCRGDILFHSPILVLIVNVYTLFWSKSTVVGVNPSNTTQQLAPQTWTSPRVSIIIVIWALVLGLQS